MSSHTDYKFEGWQAKGADSIEGKLQWGEYEPKEFADDDVDIKIHYCGICGSDLHTMSSGWGDMSSMYPQVVGHEIVGEVVRVGPAVKNIKVGDIAGVGAQSDSCLDCEYCHSNREQYCNSGLVFTYGSVYNRTSKGTKTFGGYANYWRGPAHFTVPVPAGLDPAEVAPMLCAGTTVYSPLKQYGAGTTAKDVGVIGIGGVGHMGLLFAKAMGANVTAISHSHNKDKDARSLGADNVIVTGDDAAAAIQGKERTLDLILCTSDDVNMPLQAYLSLLRPGGHFIILGLPEVAQLAPVMPASLVLNNVHIAGSTIGSPSLISEMLELAAAKGIKPWIQKWKMDDVNKAVPSVRGNARYRYVLVNEQNGGKL